MIFAKLGDTKVVKRLLNEGVNVNVKNNSGMTALMYAAAEGRYEVVHAVSEGRYEVVEILLGAGADIDAKDKNGATALMWSKKQGYGYIKTTRLLMQAGAEK